MKIKSKHSFVKLENIITEQNLDEYEEEVGFVLKFVCLDEAIDTRLANAKLIIASPFGRTLHSAAILSKELNIDMRVETDLHEWLANVVSYEFLPDDIAKKAYKALSENEGRHPIGETCLWESAEQMKKRVMKVLDKYKDFDSVIVVCHGTLMQYVLGIPHPENGQIEELTY